MKPFNIWGSAALCALLAGPYQTPVNAATLAGEQILGRAPATQKVDFLIHLPLRNSAELDQLISHQSENGAPLYHHFLSPAQFRARYGPAPETVARVATLLNASHLNVTKTETQLLHVRGTVGDVERTFATRMAVTRNATGMFGYRAVSPLAVPKGLSALGATVHGLVKTMDARPNSMRAPLPANRYAPAGDYWFDDLKQAYDYPSYQTKVIGKGVTIATVGISDFSASDAALYFGHERLGPKKTDLAPAPNLLHLIFPGSLPFDPTTGVSAEANLDVQQSGGSAPGATIVGVAVPAAGEGFLYGYSYIDENNFADIVSTSYGGCELGFTAAYNNGQDYTGILHAYHDLFRQGNSEGITFVFSSGDRAGKECPQAGYFLSPPGHKFHVIPSVQYWADDPNVTGVGGTNLVTSHIKGSLQSTYIRENEYFDREPPQDPFGTGNTVVNAIWGSGGGESVLWPKPDYQRLVNTRTKNRAVPDVAMHMGGCPFGPPDVPPCGPDRSDDVAALGGQLLLFIGTSASAPEFAGLLAVKEQADGHRRLGNANYYIYGLARNNELFPASPFFHQGIPGNNGVVSVAAGQEGYNVITGVGTPYGKNFALLRHVVGAGNPQTPSNP